MIDGRVVFATLFALVFGAVACAGSQKSGADVCLSLARLGPSSDVLCPTNTQRIENVERLGALKVPTASGRHTGLTSIARHVWCVDAGASANGPYIGLDARGAVVRTGSLRGDQPVGVWSAWSRNRPTAVTVYDQDGDLESEFLCAR